MGFLTRRLATIAPIALGGLFAILYFRTAFTQNASTAGLDIGSSFQSLGTGIGSGASGIGKGIGDLGAGIGSGVAGLFKPFWELQNLAQSFGLTTSKPAPKPLNATSAKQSQKVSGEPRIRTSGGKITGGSLAGHGGGLRLKI